MSRYKLCCVKPSRASVFTSVILDDKHEGVAWFEDAALAQEMLEAWEKVHGDGARHLPEDDK